MIDPLSHQLAAALRNRRCECQSRDVWPWKRDERCARCVALEAFDLAVAREAIIQQPRKPE